MKRFIQCHIIYGEPNVKTHYQRSKTHSSLAFLVFAFLCQAPPCEAYIQKLLGLKEVMDQSVVIVEGQVTAVDPKGRTVLATFQRAIKGQNRYKQIRMNIGVGQLYYPGVLLKRMKPGEPVILFWNKGLACVGHVDGIWFQLFGAKGATPEKTKWNFTHIELFMPRTFDGSTPDLIRLVSDVQAGKRKAPAPNPNAPKLTKGILLGLASAKPASTGTKTVVSKLPPEAIDGLEAKSGWDVEDWGDPAEIRIDDSAERGKVMHVKLQPGEKGKCALSLLLKKDLTKMKSFSLEAHHNSTAPLNVALAVRTGTDEKYFESRPVSVAPGRWKYDLKFDLTSKDYKSEATNWTHETKVSDLKSARRVTLLVQGGTGKEEIALDRIRTERECLFSRTIPLAHGGGEARGVSWADFDADGDLDALICSSKGNRLYENDGGEFKDATAKAGLKGASRCASWADYDRDGDLDLLVSTPVLWTNDKGKFKDDTRLLPPLSGRNPEGAGWCDADGDGRPDILQTNGEHGIYLFLNKEDGPSRFLNVSKEWGLGKGGLGAGNGDFLSIADFDGDGFQDFLYNLGKGVLAHNEDGESFKIAGESKVSYDADNGHKVGVAFGDYDNDGDIDLFVPQRKGSRLFRNNNDYSFTDVTATGGDLASLAGQAQSAAWGDVDSDGDLDLVAGFADRAARLFLNDGKGKFIDATDSSGFNMFSWTRDATGLAFADMDADGDLDLLVTGESTQAGVLVNSALRGQRVPVRVRLPLSESPGALVRLYDADGNQVAVRQVALVQNFSSQEPHEVFFAVKPGRYKLSLLRTVGAVQMHSFDAKAEGYSLDVKFPATALPTN